MDHLEEQQHQLQESWSTGHFDATLLTNSLKVGYIPAENLVRCTHALVKLLVLDAEESESSYRDQAGPGVDGVTSSPSGSGGILDIGGLGGAAPGFSGVNIMLVQDMGGVTVIVNDRYYMHLQLAGVVELMRWAPAPWRALQIHLGPASADAPGIISYLSSMLSDRKVSILNFSTFEADLILVQDHDLVKARQFLEDCGHDGVTGLKEQMAEKRNREGAVGFTGALGAASSDGFTGVSGPLGAASQGAGAAGAGAGAASRAKPRSNSTSSETISSAALAVVQTPLVLATIKRSMLKQSMYALMKQITRNIDAQVANRNSAPPAPAPGTEAVGSVTLSPQYLQASMLERDYLWAYFSACEEVSLLIDERDLCEFPEDALVVCQERWKAIRLVGKDIPFNETGIVQIMSSPYDLGVQLLNMSTYGTNVSLVVEDDVEHAVERLRQELNGKDTKVFGSYRRSGGNKAGSGAMPSPRQPISLSLQQLQLDEEQQRRRQTQHMQGTPPLGQTAHGLRPMGMPMGNSPPKQNTLHAGAAVPHGSRFVPTSDYTSASRGSDLSHHSHSRPMPVMMEHR